MNISENQCSTCGAKLSRNGTYKGKVRYRPCKNGCDRRFARGGYRHGVPGSTSTDRVRRHRAKKKQEQNQEP